LTPRTSGRRSLVRYDDLTGADRARPKPLPTATIAERFSALG
jgi:hypothetical protein